MKSLMYGVFVGKPSLMSQVNVTLTVVDRVMLIFDQTLDTKSVCSHCTHGLRYTVWNEVSDVWCVCRQAIVDESS